MSQLNGQLAGELELLKNKGLARTVRSREAAQLINFSSNDYLGLSRHPEVVEAAAAALAEWGVGGTASRLLAGTTPPHAQLEQALASFLGRESALVFSSGYHVNTGVIPALVSAQDVVFFDRLAHASIIDGIRLSGARIAPFDHNDVAHLREQVAKHRAKGRRALLITEGIFSMDGDRAPLADLVQVARQHDIALYLDEAHSLGVVGENGRGEAARQNVLPDVEVLVGTLSKTLGSQGGFVAGSKTLIDFLVSRCRSFAYTTALAPALASAAETALRLSISMDAERARLDQSGTRLRRALTDRGRNCLASDSQIIPVLTGSVENTKELSEHLLSQGFFVPSIRPPTVPAGEGRVRLSLSLPVLDHVDALVSAF
jgi:8-amino-7-oxononanoate synthase